ncbi:MAG: hypothetical protein A3F14_03245 [Gammaproteobacteria bacterium RIFCSPHIGHO2_12_FULL_43_28]|nr:MAG: hypothetical protein A3F14_03245 [Gammaproteobacteria bacterium RIFCSPHIGHO2_12_FULL_43_28]
MIVGTLQRPQLLSCQRVSELASNYRICKKPKNPDVSLESMTRIFIKPCHASMLLAGIQNEPEKSLGAS